MGWRIVIPGQPPTVNHAYRAATKYRRTKGGTKVAYASIIKDSQASSYQEGASLITASSRPSGWQWQGGFVRVVYRFYLHRDADCDNLLKVLNDAIASRIEVNDKWFLPMVMSKKIVPTTEARVEILIVQEGDEEWSALEYIASRPDELP